MEEITALIECRGCIEQSVIQAEEKLNYGQFDRNYAKKWFENMKDLMNKYFYIRHPPDLDLELFGRLNICVQIKPEDSIPVLLGKLRFVFYLISTTDRMCRYSSHEEIEVQLGLDTFYLVVDRLKSLLTTDIFNEKMLDEFYEIASMNLEENKAACNFIANEMSRLIQHVYPQTYVSRNLDFIILAHKTLDINKNYDKIISEYKEVDLQILNNNQRGEVLELLSRSYEAKGILPLALEKAKTAKEQYMDATRKESMMGYIHKLEEKIELREKCATRAKEKKDISEKEKYKENSEEEHEEKEKEEKDVVAYQQVFDEYIESVLLRLKYQIESGIFTMRDVDTMTTDIKSYLDSRSTQANITEIKALMIKRLCSFIDAKNIPSDTEKVLSIMRYYYNVLALFDKSSYWEYELDKDPSHRVLSYIKDVLENCVKVLIKTGPTLGLITDLSEMRSKTFEAEQFEACFEICDDINILLDNLVTTDIERSENLKLDNLFLMTCCYNIQVIIFYAMKIIELFSTIQC